MPAWNRHSDRALEAQLRAARPEPTVEVTQAIADRVRTRQAGGTHRFGRLHLALAGGLTALVLTPVVATGFGGIGSFGKTTKTTKANAKSSVAYMSKARSGRAHGVLNAKRNRALARLARLGGTPLTAGMASTGGASLASWSGVSLGSWDGVSAFFGDVFQPQNDLAATQQVYDQQCNIGAVIQENDATLTQGGNTATGGDATATGGAGGDANTGNTQTNTGGTTATGDNVQSFGGDTTASSGNATGGDGGNATAIGGDAVATNVASQTLINSVVCVPAD